MRGRDPRRAPTKGARPLAATEPGTPKVAAAAVPSRRRLPERCTSTRRPPPPKRSVVAPGLYAARAARRPRGPTASPWSAQAEPAPLAARPQAKRGGIDSHPAAAAPAVSAGRRQPGSRRGRSRNPKAFGPGSPPPEGRARDASPVQVSGPGNPAGRRSVPPLHSAPSSGRPGLGFPASPLPTLHPFQRSRAPRQSPTGVSSGSVFQGSQLLCANPRSGSCASTPLSAVTGTSLTVA